MYLTGRGTPVDVASAEAWARRAQEKGHAEAAALLARIAAKQAAPAAPKEPGWKASVATPFTTAAVPANIPNEPRLILDAARRSNIEAVRKLAASRAGLEARDEDGSTALGGGRVHRKCRDSRCFACGRREYRNPQQRAGNAADDRGGQRARPGGRAFGRQAGGARCGPARSGDRAYARASSLP